MNPFVVKPVSRRIKGKIVLPGDKSIAHRALIISAITAETTQIQNFPVNKDCLSTLRSLQRLGIKIRKNFQKSFFATISVTGRGLYGFKKAKGAIFVNDSGTTLRLILGVLAGQDFLTHLSAGKSLANRPMLRVTAPLRLMGARIKAKRQKPKDKRREPEAKSQKGRMEEYPPLSIKGGGLKPITYKIPVASAQVKSAILLAALYAKGITTVIEPLATRDHTERMLKFFRADIEVLKNKIVIKGCRELVSPKRIFIPSDISSAAFFLVLGAIIPKAHMRIQNVCLNPSRIGVIKILKRMGANIQLRLNAAKASPGEPVGDIIVKSSRLVATKVSKREIPFLIDEIPILMVAACHAKGQTIFEGISELRVKETDRIRSMSENLRKMGAQIFVSNVGGVESIKIRYAPQLKGIKARSFGDHRTAMSMVIAGLSASGSTQIDDISCISKSFPGFFGVLSQINAM